MTSPTSSNRTSLPGGHWRAATVAAVDALEDGDNNRALAILLDQLEADGPTVRPYRCPHCPVAVQWPGQLHHHLLVVHPMQEAA